MYIHIHNNYIDWKLTLILKIHLEIKRYLKLGHGYFLFGFGQAA